MFEESLPIINASERSKLRTLLRTSQEVTKLKSDTSLEQLADDYVVCLALAKLVETIGHIAKSIRPQTRSGFVRINWDDVVKMQERFNHSDGTINREILWKICSDEVPRLVQHLQTIELALDEFWRLEPPRPGMSGKKPLRRIVRKSNQLPGSPFELLLWCIWRHKYRNQLVAIILLAASLVSYLTLRAKLTLPENTMQHAYPYLASSEKPIGPDSGFVIETSVMSFLDRDKTFERMLDSTQDNLYYIGLTDNYAKTIFADKIVNKLDQGIKMTFCMYLPEDTNIAGLDMYMSIMRKYKPLGEDVEGSVRNMWADAEYPFTGVGKAARAHSDGEYVKNGSLKFYADDPKAWIVIADADSSLTTARWIYWFPYLGAAGMMERPGLGLPSRTMLSRELLKYVSSLISYARDADSQTFFWWKRNLSPPSEPEREPIDSLSSLPVQ